MCKHRTWLCFGHKKASWRKKRHTHICNALVVCHATHATLRTCMPACINDMNIWSRSPSTTGASAHACNCYPTLCHANPHHVLIPFVGCCFSLLSSPVAPLSLHLLCPFPLPPPLAPPRPLVLVVLSLSLSPSGLLMYPAFLCLGCAKFGSALSFLAPHHLLGIACNVSSLLIHLPQLPLGPNIDPRAGAHP